MENLFRVIINKNRSLTDWFLLMNFNNKKYALLSIKIVKAHMFEKYY